MTPIRLIAVATVVSCGLFLASPAMSATMPAASAPDASIAADTSDSDNASSQYAQRDKNRSRKWKSDRKRSRDHGRDRRDYRNRHRDRRGYWDRDRDRDHFDFRHRDWDRFYWDFDRHYRWRTRRHPRHPYWRGRHLPLHGRFLVITNYWDYYLPPPPIGHYYVRDGDDVFLVLEATRRIVDAFILFELLGR